MSNVILFILCLFTSGINQCANQEQNDVTLQYQQFIREDAKEHRLFLERSFDKMILIISAGTFIFGAVIAWMNWRTKDDISKAVEKRCDAQIDSLLGIHIKKLQKDLEAKNEVLTIRIKEVDRLIMELSVRLSERRPTGTSNSPLKDQSYNSPVSLNKVLWVDDKPRNNDNIVNMLSESGATFDRVRTTAEAQKKLSENNYALIISDMRRGDSPDEGLKLLRIRNKNYPSTPLVIYSSSKSLDGYREDAENEGAELVTTKITELLGYIQPGFDKA